MDREERGVRFLGAAQIDRYSRSGWYPFAARIVDDHIICLVGDEPRAALEDLSVDAALTY